MGEEDAGAKRWGVEVGVWREVCGVDRLMLLLPAATVAVGVVLALVLPGPGTGKLEALVSG